MSQPDTTCWGCPIPPLKGDPQPTTRCDPCPYHGYVRVVRDLPDGSRVTQFLPEAINDEQT